MKRLNYTFSIYKDKESSNSYETRVNNYVTKRVFFQIMDKFSEFTHVQDTVFFQQEFAKEIDPLAEEEGRLQEFIIDFDDTYLLDYNVDKYFNRKPTVLDFYKYSRVEWNRTIVAELSNGENYRDLKLLYDIAQALGKNLVSYEYLVDEAYLEALRIKDENQHIKLDPLQRAVLTSVETQCRWFHIPSDDQEAIMKCFPIQPELKEADITEVIQNVQFDDIVCMATIPGHTILFGFNLPYINYSDEADYKSCSDHTIRLKEILDRLSKVFGAASFFEYREEDPDMMRMVFSKKGKFVYASLYAEGEHSEEFGASKRSIPPDEKTYWKTVKKSGILPTDLLTYVMKQKLPVKVFRQGMYWKWFHEE
jgi:hypothetical protein